MENTRQKTAYVGYHAYNIKHVLNIDMYILKIHNMDTRKINITFTKKYLLRFQLSCILYSHLLIHVQD